MSGNMQHMSGLRAIAMHARLKEEVDKIKEKKANTAMAKEDVPAPADDDGFSDADDDGFSDADDGDDGEVTAEDEKANKARAEKAWAAEAASRKAASSSSAEEVEQGEVEQEVMPPTTKKPVTEEVQALMHKLASGGVGELDASLAKITSTAKSESSSKGWMGGMQQVVKETAVAAGIIAAPAAKRGKERFRDQQTPDPESTRRLAPAAEAATPPSEGQLRGRRHQAAGIAAQARVRGGRRGGRGPRVLPEEPPRAHPKRFRDQQTPDPESTRRLAPAATDVEKINNQTWANLPAIPPAVDGAGYGTADLDGEQLAQLQAEYDKLTPEWKAANAESFAAYKGYRQNQDPPTLGGGGGPANQSAQHEGDGHPTGAGATQALSQSATAAATEEGVSNAIVANRNSMEAERAEQKRIKDGGGGGGGADEHVEMPIDQRISHAAQLETGLQGDVRSGGTHLQDIMNGGSVPRDVIYKACAERVFQTHNFGRYRTNHWRMNKPPKVAKENVFEETEEFFDQYRDDLRISKLKFNPKTHKDKDLVRQFMELIVLVAGARQFGFVGPEGMGTNESHADKASAAGGGGGGGGGGGAGGMSAIVPLDPDQYIASSGFYSKAGSAANKPGGQDKAAGSWNGVRPPPGAIVSTANGETVYNQRLHENDHGLPTFRGLMDQPPPAKRIRVYEDPLRYADNVAPGVPATYVPPLNESLRMSSRGVIHTGAIDMAPGNIRL